MELCVKVPSSYVSYLGRHSLGFEGDCSRSSQLGFIWLRFWFLYRKELEKTTLEATVRFFKNLY